MRIVREPLPRQEIARLAHDGFGDMVKAVVDVERKIMALGGELHADQEALLLDDGSHQQDLWGINLYPDRPAEEWIEFDSLINIRPSQNNRSREVEGEEVRAAIETIVSGLVKE